MRTQEFIVRAVIGGRAVTDIVTVEGAGKKRAVVTFTATGDLVEFPLHGRRAEDVAAQVGIANLQRDFAGTLTAYTVQKHDSNAVAKVLAQTAHELMHLPAGTFLEAARELAREQTRA